MYTVCSQQTLFNFSQLLVCISNLQSSQFMLLLWLRECICVSIGYGKNDEHDDDDSGSGSSDIDEINA